MGYKNILVPYDKSESAHHALSAALGLAASDHGAKVTILYVVNAPEFDNASFEAAARMAGVAIMSEDEIENMQRYYLAHELGAVKKDIAPLIEGAENTVVCKLGSGKAAKAILDFATEHDTDLIVMGCRGLGAVRGALGSVSYGVVRQAACPVMVVK